VHPASKAAKKRVLFVCIGNSCRSQLAEVFARAYGADVIDAHSAGLSPAVDVSPLTKQFLLAHNLSADNLFPKSLDLAAKEHYDLLVNMSGKAISIPGARVLHWQVEDPIGKSEAVFGAIAGQVERLVQRLVLDLRQGG
jgi:arsenate reductase (thioredoxin)